MADYKIQLKDEHGNRQYPVSTTEVVVDADGVSVAELLNRKQDMLVSGQNIKTINGKSILGEGNIDIEGGGGGGTSDDVEAYPIYYDVDGNPLTDEQKAANKMAVDKYVADESIVLYPHMGSVGHPFDVVLTLSEGAWKTAELTNYIFAYFNDDGTTMHYVKVTVEQDGDVQVEFSAQSPLVLASKAYVDSKIQGGGGTGEAVESDVISVVYDDDQPITLSNVEAFNKLAECCETVGKPVAVMVCIESGYRWGIEHFYWSKKDEEIELVSPIRKDGMYATFTLTHEGACTASFGQVNLGSNPNNAKMFSLYMPPVDDNGEFHTLAEMRDLFNITPIPEGLVISQDVIDAWESYCDAALAHNIATMPQIEQAVNNGEKVTITLLDSGYAFLFVALYIFSLGYGEDTAQATVEALELCKHIQLHVLPDDFMLAPTDLMESQGEPFGITVTAYYVEMSIDGTGDWTQSGAIERRRSFEIVYERYSSARLTQSICDENKKALDVYINRNDIEVCYYEGNDWKTHENALVISRKDKTVDGFTDLDGSVNTRQVVSFYYLEGTNMYELQVSRHDGYCRRISLGEIQLA